MPSGSFQTTHTHDYPDKTVEFTLEVEWSASDGDKPQPWCNQWEPTEGPEVDDVSATVVAAYVETDWGREPVHEDEIDTYQSMFDALCKATDSSIMSDLEAEIYDKHLPDCGG